MNAAGQRALTATTCSAANDRGKGGLGVLLADTHGISPVRADKDVPDYSCDLIGTMNFSAAFSSHERPFHISCV